MREMKDSGIDWIGIIPEHWELRRAKSMFKQSTSKGNDRLVLLSATQDRGVVDKSTLDSVVQVSEDADLSTFKTVHKNDFVISLRSFQGGFEISHEEGVISPAYTVFRLTTQTYPHFYRHLFKSYGFIDKINSLTVGIREGKNIQYVDFADMLLPYIPLTEQQRIAEFLDRKCAEVDEMIGLQEQIIEELKAYKQSVITEAVTKGLNPDAPMRDSGIEWIGQIPAHWRIATIGRLFNIYAGGDAKWEFYSDNCDAEHPYPVYTNTLDKHQTYAYTSKPMFNGDTITVTGRGDIGHAFYRKEPFDAIIRLLVLEKKYNLDCRYFAYFIEDVIHFFTNSAAIGQLSAVQVTPYAICHPALVEQQAIADYLDEKCADIDSLIQTKLSKIDSLKEYKKSIIYEYVTGKREVK